MSEDHVHEAVAAIPLGRVGEPELVVSSGGHRFEGTRSIELLAQRLGYVAAP